MADLSVFFKTSGWNGFKIGYTTSTSNNYTQIIASENSNVSYRPVMTIKYTYWPSGGIEGGAVYSFVNSASNKYLTVDSSGGTNVYQCTKDNTRSQAFRLDYDEVNTCFRIRTMGSSDGYGDVLEAPNYTGTINGTSGYTNSNVRVHSYSSAWANDQEWIISPCGYSDLYRIALRADPNLVLTTYGTGNGTSGGTAATSEGNVFLSEFTGAANQLWKMESGGIPVGLALNIKEANANLYSYTMYENEDWLSLCCPATEFGDTVTWTSTLPSSVKVDSAGHITACKAGRSTLIANVQHADGTNKSYACTVYVALEDGTYYFNNVNNHYRLEYEDTTALYENAILEVFNSGTAEPSARYRMFKVKHLGKGVYSIRSLLDSSMGWTGSGTELVMTTVGTSDATVPSKAKWKIEFNSNGYYIYCAGYGISRTVTSPSSSGEDIVLQSYSFTNTLQNWTINKVTQSYHGITMKDMVSTLAVGNTATFTAAVFSTSIDENGNGVTWSVTNGTGRATINSSTGVLTGVSKGTVTVTATYRSWSASCTVVINYGWPTYTKPTIHSRSEWGARACIEDRLIPRQRQPERLIFHHSADKFTKTNLNDVIAEIQRIQNYHMDERTKCDIAYHFIIDPAGRIWEGAKIDNYQRGHTTGYFDDIGVLVLGDFESRGANVWNPNVLNESQKNAMEVIAKWLCYQYDLPINLEQNVIPIFTHRNLCPDDVCPGSEAAPWIENNLRTLIGEWYSSRYSPIQNQEKRVYIKDSPLWTDDKTAHI